MGREIFAGLREAFAATMSAYRLNIAAPEFFRVNSIALAAAIVALETAGFVYGFCVAWFGLPEFVGNFMSYALMGLAGTPVAIARYRTILLDEPRRRVGPIRFSPRDMKFWSLGQFISFANIAPAFVVFLLDPATGAHGPEIDVAAYVVWLFLSYFVMRLLPLFSMVAIDRPIELGTAWRLTAHRFAPMFFSVIILIGLPLGYLRSAITSIAWDYNGTGLALSLGFDCLIALVYMFHVNVLAAATAILIRSWWDSDGHSGDRSTNGPTIG